MALTLLRLMPIPNYVYHYPYRQLITIKVIVILCAVFQCILWWDHQAQQFPEMMNSIAQWRRIGNHTTHQFDQFATTTTPVPTTETTTTTTTPRTITTSTDLTTSVGTTKMPSAEMKTAKKMMKPIIKGPKGHHHHPQTKAKKGQKETESEETEASTTATPTTSSVATTLTTTATPTTTTIETTRKSKSATKPSATKAKDQRKSSRWAPICNLLALLCTAIAGWFMLQKFFWVKLELCLTGVSTFFTLLALLFSLHFYIVDAQLSGLLFAMLNSLMLLLLVVSLLTTLRHARNSVSNLFIKDWGAAEFSYMEVRELEADF